MWVLCLNFLQAHAMSVIGWQDKMKPELYFTNYKQVVRGRGEEYTADELETDQHDSELITTLFSTVDAVANVAQNLGPKDKKVKKIKSNEKHKFNNIDAKAFNAIVNH